MSQPDDLAPRIAADLQLPLAGVGAVVRLLADKATVPFIARYRKEMTGALDEVQIRAIEERHAYLGELEARRTLVLETISGQGKLSAELEARIRAAQTKNALEDLYLPFKPKRRTRAMMARERGLEPLARRILEQPERGDPRAEASRLVNAAREVPDTDAALAGARDIVAEVMAERADVRTLAREVYGRGGVESSAVPKKTQEPTKFEQYYDFGEAVTSIPSHRYLAICRGESEGVLRVRIAADTARLLGRLGQMMGVQARSPFAAQLVAAIDDGLTRLLGPAMESDVRAELKVRADIEASKVFARNLRDLLLAPPLGGKAVVGIDPGLRTGCKCVALSDTGRYLGSVTLYLSQGQEAQARATKDLLAFLGRWKPEAIAVGNGTGGRETEAFVRATLGSAGLPGILCVAVSEAGASVYSASDIAREEFPDLDLTLRGAISIGRRLQDPLAELVKVQPEAIGVGQYQHDVQASLLTQKLGEVVESCVNHVGVELNTASAPLLGHVAGIGPSLARKIVAHRDAHGPFPSRSALLKVSGLGPRAFEQAAGFLRVRGGSHPLDASAVHPERYALVENMAADLGAPLRDLVGHPQRSAAIDVRRYVGPGVGEPTLRDILDELHKPGRDPRKQFEPPRFRDDVHALTDLRPGMVLEGVVTNVTPFGAFVDVGVHQDGLVHISQLSEQFVRDPHTVVAAGDRLTVRVVEVDLARKRIALSARTGERRGDADAARAGGVR